MKAAYVKVKYGISNYDMFVVLWLFKLKKIPLVDPHLVEKLHGRVSDQQRTQEDNPRKHFQTH